MVDPNTSFVYTFKVADINNDGLLGLVAAEMEQSPLRRISVYYNQGGALKWKKQVVGRSGSHNPRVADFINDAEPSIFVLVPMGLSEAWMAKHVYRKNVSHG